MAMTESEERAYMEGQRALLLRQLIQILKELGHGPQTEVAELVAEREAAVIALRRLCEDHGDNDWPNELHLADVIEKHLERHLRQ